MTKDINKIIGKKIKEARIKMGMTQKQLAEELGVNYNNIIDYEKGRRKFISKHFVRTCEVLGLDIDVKEKK